MKRPELCSDCGAIMNQAGQVVTWSPGTGFSTPTERFSTPTDPTRVYNDAYVVDVEPFNGQPLILNDTGQVLSPGGFINDPHVIGNYIGKEIFVDMEIYRLSDLLRMNGGGDPEDDENPDGEIEDGEFDDGELNPTSNE
ncbi:MAG: hypothetical protein ACOX5R_09975 [bacterium]